MNHKSRYGHKYLTNDNLERQVERCYLLKLLPVPLDAISSILWERILGHRRCAYQSLWYGRFDSYAQGLIFVVPLKRWRLRSPDRRKLGRIIC